MGKKETKGQNDSSTGKPDGNNEDRESIINYSGMFRKFVLIALASSVVPLLLVGWGINIHYSIFNRSSMLESFQERISRHQKSIELFLNNQRSIIQIIAQTNRLDYLSNKKNLTKIYEAMNYAMKRKSGRSFTDLGIISHTGKHLSYVGPYDLMNKNYEQTVWFKEVMEKGSYISDMFLGFRKSPHFIVAVSRAENGQKWILRATINAEAFRSLVENVKIGKTGEVYLVNSKGILQTQPRFSGKIMGKTLLPPQTFHQGLIVETIVPAGDLPKQIVAHAWLTAVPWLLVVKQDYSEAFKSLNHANYATLIFLHFGVLVILIVSFFTTRYMIRIIKERDNETKQMNKQLIQTSKMASIGALSASVAHEVNNPLAIIMTERQILLDKAAQTSNMDDGFSAQLNKSLSQIDTQLKRCKNTTHNLLRFSRRTKSKLEEVDLNIFLQEMVDIMERDAESRGIKFFTDFNEGIPQILSDPSQLQQVFLNLIKNAIEAHGEKPYGSVRISTAAEGNKAVKVTITDKGTGIRMEHIEKIFDPFFTTKPVGKGTGLGLSVCYSIIKRLGGEITVESEPGEGTEFSILFSVTPPDNLRKNIGSQTKDS